MGPLHSNLEYTVTAQKEGFVLSAVEGTVGDFKAFALAGVTFEVIILFADFLSAENPTNFNRLRSLES